MFGGAGCGTLALRPRKQRPKRKRERERGNTQLFCMIQASTLPLRPPSTGRSLQFPPRGRGGGGAQLHKGLITWGAGGGGFMAPAILNNRGHLWERVAACRIGLRPRPIGHGKWKS